MNNVVVIKAENIKGKKNANPVKFNTEGACKYNPAILMLNGILL